MAVLTPRARTLFQVTVAFLVLAVAAVVLRFAVRVHKKRSPLVSDYLITCALCVFIAHCGIIFKGPSFLARRDATRGPLTRCRALQLWTIRQETLKSPLSPFLRSTSC